MTDPMTFVRARLDEDEAAARSAGGLRWVTGTTGAAVEVHGDDYAALDDDDIGTVVYDEGAPTDAQAGHIARHDPARVLRDVEAKRRILAEYEQAEFCEKAALGEVALVLATAWSDHSDYNPAWDPEWTT